MSFNSSLTSSFCGYCFSCGNKGGSLSLTTTGIAYCARSTDFQTACTLVFPVFSIKWREKEGSIFMKTEAWSLLSISLPKKGEGDCHHQKLVCFSKYRVSCCCCCCCFCCIASVMSDSVRPLWQQPTRLPYPWDSPGKNTGVGCHFLLQNRKVKSESEVAKSCPTLSDPSRLLHSWDFSRQQYRNGVSLPSTE